MQSALPGTRRPLARRKADRADGHSDKAALASLVWIAVIDDPFTQEERARLFGAPCAKPASVVVRRRKGHYMLVVDEKRGKGPGLPQHWL
eukprot:15442179-Alexandrium_andersonii.AAC.1